MMINVNIKQTIVFGENVSSKKNQVKTEKLNVPKQKESILIGHIWLSKYGTQYFVA